MKIFRPDDRIVLYLGNSPVFDHDWTVPGTFAVNCARQGMIAADLDIDTLPPVSPDLVVIGFGPVELLRAATAKDTLDPDAFGAVIDGQVTALARLYPDAALLILGAPPLRPGRSDVNTAPVNEALQGVAGRRGAAWAPMPSADLYDGIHLRHDQYGPWHDAIGAALAKDGYGGQ